MADYLTTDSELEAVADAIRAKGATSALLVYPSGFVSAINAIPTGITPTGTKSITISAAGTTTEDVTNYASAEITVPSGSASTPATSITANPTISVSSAGLITASVSASQSVTPSVSAGYVSSGTAGTVSVSGSNTSQLTTQAAQTITPTTTDQTIASGKYLTGTQTIKGDANLVAGNIKKDVSIFGVTGTYEGGGGGGITVTNYSILGEDSIDFSGQASDLFSVSSGGMTIATVPIFIEEDTAEYQFTCFGVQDDVVCFGGFGGSSPIFADFIIVGSVLALDAVTTFDGTPLTARLDDTKQMNVYSTT